MIHSLTIEGKTYRNQDKSDLKRELLNNTNKHIIVSYVNENNIILKDMDEYIKVDNVWFMKKQNGKVCDNTPVKECYES